MSGIIVNDYYSIEEKSRFLTDGVGFTWWLSKLSCFSTAVWNRNKSCKTLVKSILRFFLLLHSTSLLKTIDNPWDNWGDRLVLYNDKNSCQTHQSMNLRRRCGPLTFWNIAVRTKIHYYTLCLKSTTINGGAVSLFHVKRIIQNFKQDANRSVMYKRERDQFFLPFDYVDRLCICRERDIDREFVLY